VSKKAQYPHGLSESNCIVDVVDDQKVRIAFPKDGTMRMGKSKFHDREDFQVYMGAVFPEMNSENGIPVSLRGKYRRLDENGRNIFTFGDPLLDLVTDRFGFIIKSATI